MSLKHIIDSIGDHILPGLARGRADGDKRLQFEIKQEKRNPKEYAVRITIIPLDNSYDAKNYLNENFPNV